MAPTEAISLLRADHRRVEEWFKDYDSVGSNIGKELLASNICRALRIHAKIEEAIFRQAFLHATCNRGVYEAAVQERENAKRLIEKIEQSCPDLDEVFDSRVRLLSDLIQQHIDELEKPGGIFAATENAGIDLRSVGELQAAARSS